MVEAEWVKITTLLCEGSEDDLEFCLDEPSTVVFYSSEICFHDIGSNVEIININFSGIKLANFECESINCSYCKQELVFKDVVLNDRYERIEDNQELDLDCKNIQETLFYMS